MQAWPGSASPIASANDSGYRRGQGQLSLGLALLVFSPHLGVLWGNSLKPQALSWAVRPPPWGRTNLSSLFHDGGVGRGVALGGADEPTGAQEAEPGGRDVPRRDLVLAGVPSAHAAAHRAGRREGVGLPKAATVGANREQEEHGSPSGLLTPTAASGTPPGVCSHFDS